MQRPTLPALTSSGTAPPRSRPAASPVGARTPPPATPARAAGQAAASREQSSTARIVVIRGGSGAAETGTNGGCIRAPAVAKLLRIDGDVAVVQRIQGRFSRHVRWAKPVRVPAGKIVRDATAREVALGYPVT